MVAMSSAVASAVNAVALARRFPREHATVKTCQYKAKKYSKEHLLATLPVSQRDIENGEGFF